MLNYLECSRPQFEEAMRMVGADVKMSDFPTELLYIAYTRYHSVVRDIDTGSSYAYDVYFRTKRRHDQFGQELVRRGVPL